MYQNNPSISTNALPSMYDLPSEDPEEMGLPDEFHDFQPDLLRETCHPKADEFFIGADINLYYDTKHTGWYKRPDWFLVIGVSASKSIADSRLSYVMWQEHIAPFLMVELISPGTEAEDLGQTLRVLGKPPTKWQVYEKILRVPYYAIYDRYSNKFRMFSLQATQYVEIAINNDQRFWFEEIELGIGIWNGSYQGIVGQWLRWYNQAGNWILTNEERTQIADKRLVQANLEADQERKKNELLSAKLKELGVNVDEII
jgi:Uma2 family endonuclease